MRTMRSIVVLLLVTTLLGCWMTSWHASREELIGTYETKFPLGAETIVLNKNGTYRQTLRAMLARHLRMPELGGLKEGPFLLVTLL